MTNPLTCPCGSDTFTVIATLPVPVQVARSVATIKIDKVLGSIARVDAHCASCGQATANDFPNPLQSARAAALTALAQAKITTT